MKEKFNNVEKHNFEVRYPTLFTFIKEFCLFKCIVEKQKEHAESYPNDIKILRSLYNDYPFTGYASENVTRFISHINFMLNKIVGMNKPYDTNLYTGIYSYGYDNEDKYFFKNVYNKIIACENAIKYSLKENFNFEKDRINFSSYKIEQYLLDAYDKSLRSYHYKPSDLVSTYFYKWYINEKYLNSLEYIANALNGDFYGEYVQLSANTFKDEIRF